VLIVEDNLDGVHSLVLLLRDMGHTVDYAINGYAAVDLIKSCRPEIVLLDLNLPGLSGFEVCKRIKKIPELRHIRFVALTAFGQDAYRESAKSAGCERYYVKPIAPSELEELLETL
jgi:CheY-like chemotaxis protein